MKVKIGCQCFISAVLGMVLCADAQQAWAALATTTTLAVTSGGSAVTTVTSGSVVKLTATVMAGSSAVTPGQVNFCDATATYCTDIHLLGTAQLTSNGTAVLKFRPGIGSHSYKAVFEGTTSDAASSSSASALTVTGKYATTTTVSQSGSAGNYTLTATVAGYAGGCQSGYPCPTGVAPVAPPTGTVSFLDTSNGNSVLGTAALGAGASALGWLNSQTPAAGQEPSSVVVGDFNGDGIPDLALADAGSTSGYAHLVTILLGNGDGTFTPAATSPEAGEYPISMAEGDFNGDGIPDLAVANYVYDTLTILLGNGDGTFTPAGVKPTTGNGPDSVVVADFNGDGIPDLAVSNDYSNTVTILLGNGDGTFTAAAASPATGNVPVSLAVGDFNGDGKPDLAVANYQDGTVTILLGNGDGSFTPVPTSPATGTDPYSVAVADFNGDGKLDLAVANKNGGNAGTVTILLGNGDGTFTAAAASPATGNGPESLAVGDFNGDGIPDLAVANNNDGNAGTVTILLGNGDGTFTAATVSPATGNGPDSVAVGDFSGGGVPGLAVANATDNTATVLLAQNQTATATASGIAPVGTGTHLVEASYPGDSNYSSSISGTTGLTAIAGPAMSFSLTSVSFSPENVGATSAPQTVTVTNSGTANLTLSTVAMGGTNASDFTKSADTCTGATVKPSSTCAVSVTFTPSATGALSASLNFTDNASGSPQSIALSGTGQDFTLAVSSGSSASATVAPGSPTSYTLSFAGQGGFNQSVSFTCAGAPSEATCTVSPSQVNAGATATSITVSVTTTAPSASAPRSRHLPPAPPLSPGLGGLFMLALVLTAMAWAMRRRNQLGVSRWQSAMVPLASALLITLALAGCGGGGSSAGTPPSNSGTPAGTYTLTVTGTVGSGSSALSHSVNLTLTVT